ncbi:hypothetical protein RUM43_002015 [Polyplax serrata]|uniref:Glyoxylate reductase/hydroxypyruvate reductase n=1 Tax=Polyplax serrata TaxID=468196 RepID=A0AAN8PZ24_POLSC
MSSYSVFVTRPDIPKIAFDILEKKGYKVSTWTEERPVPRSVLLKEVKGKDALLCVLTDTVDLEILNAAGSNLKVISTMSVGYEHLDINEIKKRKIRIGYTPGVLTEAVAELTLALLLATSRRLFESHEAILDAKWPSWSPSWMCGRSLKNSTVGIVGFGRIGQQIAKLLQPFSVSQILYTGRSEKPDGKALNAKFTEFNDLIKLSDFIIVTCALTPETKGLFNKNVFNNMKSTCIFINTSRGAVVVQEDLIDALKTGKIGAAGLDVMVPEPIPPDHELLKLKNCVVIPHIGSASIDTRRNMAELTANNIVSALEGKPMPAELL